MLPRLLLLLSITVLLAACQFPHKVGGPCTYVTALDNFTVIKVNSSSVQLKNAHNQLEIALSYFDSPPTIEQRYLVDFSQISQGSCTPVSIHSVELIID